MPRVAAVTLAVVLACVLAVTPSAGGAEPTAVTVTAAPIVNVRDGDAVSINIKTARDHPVVDAEARLCRSGVDYQTSTARTSADDARVGGANCPPTPVSSSADATVRAPTSIASNALTADGETFSLKVGAGTVDWKSSDGVTTYSLTCDESNPCALVVEVRSGPTGEAPTWTPTVFPVTYRTSDPITGCGGPADGIVPSAGSDRMFDFWVDLTLSACQGDGVHGAPTRASFTGESDAVSSFADGLVDLAYTGLGYGDGTDLVSGDAVQPTTRRPEVMVPIALNAAVIAVGNGRPDPSTGRKVPYTDVKLTLAEVATLLSGGHYAMDPYTQAIYDRDPQLKDTGLFDTNSDFKVGGPAGGDTGTWITTSALEGLRPDAWKVPDQGAFRAEAGHARTASASLATATPSFQTALSLFSGRPVLARSLNALGATDYGGIYVLTDLATADAFGLTPVQIENAKGDFVAPTPESVAAAVPFMKKTANGTLLPDPSATATEGAQPYPLAFVEYAMAPAQPLREDAPSCALRPSSQTLLRNWLGYVTGPGQTQLSKGFVPLPAGLAGDSATAINAVGASPTTGACVDAAGAGTTPSLPGDTASGGTVQPPPIDTAAATDDILSALGVPPDLLPAIAPVAGSAAGPATAPAAPANPVARAAAAVIRPIHAIVDPRRVGQLAPTLALLAVLAIMTAAVRLSAKGETWRLF